MAGKRGAGGRRQGSAPVARCGDQVRGAGEVQFEVKLLMAQKLKGTLSFIAKVRGWVPQGSVMHPSSKALPRTPLPCAPSPCTPSAP